MKSYLNICITFVSLFFLQEMLATFNRTKMGYFVYEKLLIIKFFLNNKN